MYDHIDKGWFAISFMVLGIMSVAFVLVLFMFGERPLGLLLFKRKYQPPEDQTPGERTPREESTPPHLGLTPVPEPGKNLNASGSSP